MWPVVIRELRVAGRDYWNKWYRVMAAVSVLLIGWFTRLFDPTSDGSQLFATVHLVLFAIIWIFVPLATADCISKERREGTLGLLFLTPLRAWQVVVAKSLVQVGRAAFMWLAAVPVLTVSFLMGGVTKWEVVLSVLIHFSSVCCALAAGIAVSAWFTEWSRAVIAALVVSAVVLIGYLELYLWIAFQVPVPSGMWDLDRRWFVAFNVAANWTGSEWQAVTAQGQPAMYVSWVKWMAVPCLVSVLFLVVAVVSSGLVVRWSIKAKARVTNSPLLQACAKVLFPDWHRFWSRRRLERNPVGWLEQRTWSARTLQWAWLAVIVTAYAVMVGGAGAWDSYHSYYAQGHRMLGWGLLAALGMAAAGSFRRERENGMLSLLLITPLTPDTIVMGRVKGIWSQIRWATVLFVAGWVYLQGFSYGYVEYFWMFFFTVSYLTLPVTGLFCSLWRKSYFAALLWTFFLGIAYPLAVGLLWALIVIILLNGVRNLLPVFLIMAGLVQIAVAYIRGRELMRKLESRSFAF